MEKHDVLVRTVVCGVFVAMLAGCAAPWKVAAVSLKENPGACGATSGFVPMSNPPSDYVATAGMSTTERKCAIAEVTLVPSGNTGTPKPTITLYTRFDHFVANVPLVPLKANYVLPAPTLDPRQRVFAIVAASSNTARYYPTFAHSNLQLKLFIGDDIEVERLECFISLGAGIISC